MSRAGTTGRAAPILERVFLVVALCIGCSRPAVGPSIGEVQILLESSNGAQIPTTLYPVDSANPPGLLLVPGEAAGRNSWSGFAAKAQRKGLACLAIELRPIDAKAIYGHDDLANIFADLSIAREILVERGADPDSLAIIAASEGANLALNWAVDHPEIAAIVLLSPGLTYRGVSTEKALVELGVRPVLLMTSAGDAYSAASCRKLKERAPSFCELREYPGAAHGMDLLERSEQANEQILLWLSEIFGPTNPP